MKFKAAGLKLHKIANDSARDDIKVLCDLRFVIEGHAYKVYVSVPNGWEYVCSIKLLKGETHKELYRRAAWVIKEEGLCS